MQIKTKLEPNPTPQSQVNADAATKPKQQRKAIFQKLKKVGKKIATLRCDVMKKIGRKLTKTWKHHR